MREQMPDGDILKWEARQVLRNRVVQAKFPLSLNCNTAVAVITFDMEARLKCDAEVFNVCVLKFA
jgi:hypothetical protein